MAPAHWHHVRKASPISKISKHRIFPTQPKIRLGVISDNWIEVNPSVGISRKARLFFPPSGIFVFYLKKLAVLNLNIFFPDSDSCRGSHVQRGKGDVVPFLGHGKVQGLRIDFQQLFWYHINWFSFLPDALFFFTLFIIVSMNFLVGLLPFNSIISGDLWKESRIHQLSTLSLLM